MTAVQDILTAATSAPSVHNTQPWRFEHTESDGTVTLSLYAEGSRQLSVLDPESRQLMISCGAALDHALLAARAAGKDVTVEVGTEPLARLSWTEGSHVEPADERLAAAIPRRHTYRDRFTAEPVSEQELDALRDAAVAQGCVLQVVTQPDQLLQLEVMLARADAEQQRDRSYREELVSWTDAPAESGFGIPLTSRDPSAGAGSSLALRDFGGPAAAADPPVVDHPSVLVLVSDTDDRTGWLAAGRALSRVLLTATVAGLAAQPLGQVTDSLGWRTRVRVALGLSGHVQMVLRVGHPAHSVPATPRHPIS
jgi:hypothetical protein